MTSLTERALTVRCPSTRCQAEPGEPCTSDRARSKQREPHVWRLNAYSRADDEAGRAERAAAHERLHREADIGRAAARAVIEGYTPLELAEAGIV